MTMRKHIVCGLLGLLFCGAASAQEGGEWPCFHGESRNNKSSETGLLAKWSEGTPELLWTLEGLGKGYSSVSVAAGYLYTAGVVEGQTYVFAFDLEGNQIWKRPNGQAWEATRSHARPYAGSRATPTCDGGLVYHLGDLGRLAAFHSGTGEEAWVLEVRERFGAEIPKYGYAESVLIDGQHLYCSPGGENGFAACLDKMTGSVIWANADIPGEVGFSSAILAESAGYRQLVNLSSNCVYGLETSSGRLLWSIPFENARSNNCTDAIFHNGHVFASSGYGKGCILIRLAAVEGDVVPETVWRTHMMDNHHGGVILHEGYLYGAGHNARGWFCLDFSTGARMWKAPGKGSLTYADGMLYMLEERGVVKLVRATPEKHEQISIFTVPEGGEGMHWAHPVVCGGRLYIRHADKLFAYRIGSG